MTPEQDAANRLREAQEIAAKAWSRNGEVRGTRVFPDFNPNSLVPPDGYWRKRLEDAAREAEEEHQRNQLGEFMRRETAKWVEPLRPKNPMPDHILDAHKHAAIRGAQAQVPIRYFAEMRHCRVCNSDIVLFSIVFGVVSLQCPACGRVVSGGQGHLDAIIRHWNTLNRPEET